ncbi:MAG: VWA domain-containing protein, partial [Calditrichaeota bacterium]
MNHSEQSIRLTRADGVPAEQVALQWQFYQGKVAGPVARFTLEQQFSNQGNEPLELLYTFPLNSDMVITGFRLLINGRLVEGEVKPLEEVQEAFDRAVLEGNTASFLHQHRSNVFTLNVGNLAPGDELRVQLRLIQWLELKGGQLRLMLPTVVGPRYIPGRPTGAGTGFGWAEPTDQVPDADWITPPVSPEGVPYRTSFHIEIAETLPVRSVESPSHRIRVERQGEATVIRSATNSRSNRDVVVTVELAALPEGRAWSTALEEGHLVSFWLKGPANPSGRRQPLDVIFLIDVSGSMAYEKLEVVKQAVRLCLRKLSSRDRFNLMAFSSDFEVWRREWQAMDEASLAAAERWLIGQEAHGGTELLPALQSALKQPVDPERQPLLVLLTDGQVGNEAAIAAEFAERGRGWRVLLFGIDTAVNQELFQQITQVCSGLVEYIYPGEPLEHKVNL